MLLTSSGWEGRSRGQWGDDGEQPWSGTKAWLKASPGPSACAKPRRICCQSCTFCWIVPGLVGIWDASQAGIYTSVPCRKVQMSRKPIAMEYWKSSPALTTWSAFIAPLVEGRAVLGKKYCRWTCSGVKHGSIARAAGCSMGEVQKCSVLRGWMQFRVQFQ